MQVSPVDIQAWASDTGAEYPSTPAEKAAVLPAVMAWKQEQLQDAAASRGQNALNVPLMAAAGAGLGIAGLAAFNHFRRQGHSEPVAAAKAREAEVAVAPAVAAAAAATPGATNSPATAYRTVDPELQALRARSSSFNGPRLRNDESGPTAATLETRGGRNIGSTLAREQGQYKARSTSGFHDPDLAVLDTPAKREAYLAGMADAKGVDSEEFQQAQQLIAAMETSTGDGVNPRDFIKGIAPQERYGTSTAAEQAKTGRFLAQSRTKSNKSAQADYRPRDTTPQREAIIRENGGGQLRALLEAAAAESSGDMGATVANVLPPGAAPGLIEGSDGRGKAIGVDPKKASVFYLDTDGQYRTYLGSEKIGSRKRLLYTGRKLDGSPISESDLAYFPTDDSEFYARSGLAHPALAADEIAANAGAFTDARYATDEDQAIKGMLESLGPSDPRFSDGIRKGGVSDNWTVGTNGAGERVPLDVSGFQSELGSSGSVAGARLRAALSDYRSNTGTSVPTNVGVAWASDLARQHGVDASTVLRAATAAGPGARLIAPQPERTARPQTHALAAGSGDALDRVYTSLGMHAGADAWELEGMVRSGDIRGAASALASQLPALTQVNAGGLRGMGQDEKLNLVAEGVTAGLQDLSTVLTKYPEAASKFGIGKGAGGFGIDAYLKSYVRDWVTVRGLQLDPTGQPTYQVPNDAFEILAHRAHQNGHDTLVELDHTVRGSSNGLLGALKLDRLVSSAQSTKVGDPNTNATSFAQTVFDMTDRDLVSTRLLDEAAGDVKLSFGTRRTSDTSAGFYNRNPSEDDIDARISDYRTLSDGTVAGYSVNATLAAQASGADYRTPEGKARKEQAKAAQEWITANADGLERQRADLNRGLIGGQSIGRGFVISANERGAFIDGDTAGMNAAYREELVNDEDTTPLDRAQDHIREAQLNNQIPEPEGVEVEARSTAVPLSEADATARQYGSQKLYFKNLGPGSKGAMAAGEAFYPRQALRRYLQERGQDAAVGQILDSYMGSSWQPEAGVGFEVGASEPIRGIGPSPAPPAAPITLSLSPEIDRPEYTVREGLVDGAVDPYQSWYRPAARRLPGTESTVREFPLIPGGFKHTGSLPDDGERRMGFVADKPQVIRQHLPNNVTLVPAMRVEGYPDRPDQIAFTTDWESRPVHPRQPLTSDQIMEMYGKQPRSAVQPEVNTATAALHREALEARAGGGDGFRDDQQFRDVAAGRVGAPLQRALLDQGELSGLGRSGSTFAQKPIAAAPVSSVPAAALDQLNTLRSSLERPVANYTEQETADARARHIGDYISSAATPTFDKAGRQTRGWTGGDSWHGGARLAGRADRNVGAYVPPSDAMVATLAKLARRRAGVA